MNHAIDSKTMEDAYKISRIFPGGPRQREWEEDPKCRLPFIAIANLLSKDPILKDVLFSRIENAERMAKTGDPYATVSTIATSVRPPTPGNRLMPSALSTTVITVEAWTIADLDAKIDHVIEGLHDSPVELHFETTVVQGPIRYTSNRTEPAKILRTCHIVRRTPS